MDSLIIRECVNEDLDYIISLQKQWAEEEITYGFIPADKNYLKSKLGKYFYVAELNSEIIGFAYGTVHEAKDMAVFDNGQLYIEIDDIYTCLHSRKKGIGSLLINKILEVAKENGVERSLIYSSTKDTQSILNFYQNHDYKTWYIQMYK